MSEMQEILTVEKARRFPESGKSARISRAAHALALSLTAGQKSLLAQVITESEDDGTTEPLRACLLSPSCLRSDLREANFVIDRFNDGQLYCHH